MAGSTRTEIASFLSSRGFCPTGKGGGTDNSCASKDGGGGGGGDGWGPPPKEKKMPEVPISNKETEAGKKAGDVVDFYGSKAKLISPEQAAKNAETQKEAAKKLGFKSGLATKVDHPSQVGVGQYVHIKDKSGAEIIGEVSHMKPSADGKQYDAVVMTPGRGKDNDMQKPVSIDLKPGATIHTVRGINDKAWKPSSGKKMKPSKTKHGPDYLHRSIDMSMVETRSISMEDDDTFPILAVETRCAGDGAPDEKWVVGYAARFGVNSLKMNDFYERIDPNAFSIVTERRGRKSALETRALFNHDPNHILGRFPNTLRMTVDEQGLKYEIEMPESRSDIVEAIQRGDIRGSSFSFILSPGGDEWSVEEGRSIRTVKSVAALVDVGPVTYPAYPDASVTVAKRSYDRFVASREKMPERKSDELRDFLRSHGR
jgi:HK97 family phage prohead protease